MKAITSFQNGSGGGPDGLLPQHLKDLTGNSVGDGGVSLLASLGGLLSLILEGRTPPPIRPLFYGANLTALTKKAVEFTPLPLAAPLEGLLQNALAFMLWSPPQHCCTHINLVLVSQEELMQPSMLPASIYRKCLTTRLSSKWILGNAFNSIRCDKMLEAVEAYIPELLPFVHSAYSTPSILLWNEVEISSSEGIQQGTHQDLCCLSHHP